jgi:hypothetical protein
MCTGPSVEVPSRRSHLHRTSSRIPAALLLHASPVFDNKRVIPNLALAKLLVDFDGANLEINADCGGDRRVENVV